MWMEKSLSRRIKTIGIFCIVIILVSFMVYMAYYKEKKEPYAYMVGDWQISPDYEYPPGGFSSKYASAEELVGKKIKIKYADNQLSVEWEGEQYQLEEKYELDKDEFAHTYMLKWEEVLSKYDFPMTKYVFCNDTTILTAIIILVDQKEDVYVRFNDTIGDWVVFALEKR